MRTGEIFNDYIKNIGGSQQANFPYEPEGDIHPDYDPVIEEAWSLPSTDGNGVFYPSERSTYEEGFNPDAGEWNISGIGMLDADYQILKSFRETLPPNNLFIFHKDRIGESGTDYLVLIAKLKGNWNREWEWWEYNIKLLNMGVIV